MQTPEPRSSLSSGPVAAPAVATSRLAYVPGLDGLRGVAVTAVVVYHLWPGVLSGGFLGVDVFFVLSGYLLSSLLVHSIDRTGRIEFGSFLVARMRRLLPAMVLVLTAVVVFAAVELSELEAARVRQHTVAGLLNVANWRFVLDGTTYTDVVAGASPLRHLWSLSIEEQFYVVLAGAVALLVMRSSGRDDRLRLDRLRRRLGLGAAVLASASAAGMVLGWWAGASQARLYFGTDTRAQAMLIGVVLGAWLVGRAPSRSMHRPAAVATLFGAAVLVTLMIVARESSGWMYAGGFTVAALSAGAVIAGMQVSPLRSLLEWRPLVGLGHISYGVYLWHWPVLVLLTGDRLGLTGQPLRFAQLAITLVASLLSYHLVEQPIRHGVLGRAVGRRAVLLGPAAVVVLIGFTVWATRPVPPTGGGAVPALVAPVSDPESDADPVPDPDPGTGPDDGARPGSEPPVEPDRDHGAGGGSTGPRRAVVLGDSVAHSLAGGSVGAFPDFTPWDPSQSPFDPSLVEVISIAKPACSFLPGEVASFQLDGSYTSVSLEPFCDDWSGELDTLLAAGSDDNGLDDVLVVLSNDVMDREVDGELVRFRSQEHDRLIIAFLDDLYERIGPERRLVLVAPSRREPDPNPDAGWREPALADLLGEYATDRNRAMMIDLGPIVCPDDRCLDWRDDGLHFTDDGARLVAAAVTERLLASGQPVD